MIKITAESKSSLLGDYDVKMNKFGVFVLLIGTMNFAQAEPADLGRVPTASSSDQAQEKTVASSSAIVQPIQDLTQPSTTSESNTNEIPQKSSNASLFLAGSALFFALLALLFAFLLKRKYEKQNSDGLQKMKQLKFDVNRVRQDYIESKNDFDIKLQALLRRLEHLEAENEYLKAENKKLRASFANNTSEMGVANAKPYFNISGEFDVGTLEKEQVVETDEDILDEISDFVKPLLLASQNDRNVEVFNEAFDKYINKEKIVSFLMLKNTLTSSSSRYFDALVLFLKEPLSSGANTLVYLRKETIQHSKISFIFNNVPDGSKIDEVILPAQLKQSSFSELSFEDANIVRKGDVSLGGNK